MQIDIEYLLFLQELRNATGGIFDEFFNMISKIAVDIMPILPYIIFWSINKGWGYRFLGTFWSGEIVNGIIKLTACAYRPWIRDARIDPAGDSKVAATGYSFPSGHTMCATATYGLTAVWQYKKRKILSVLCIVMIVLTGFSRNFLGVHTPQDVIVSLAVTSFIVWASGKVGNILKDNEKLTDIMSIVGVLLAILAIVYIKIKPYPLDIVNGNLLVDPQKMMPDTFKAAGGFIGFIIGSYIERHYIKYEIPFGSKELPLLTCVGSALVYIWINLLTPIAFKVWFGNQWGNFISFIIMVILVMTVYPWFIMKQTSNNLITEKEHSLSA